MTNNYSFNNPVSYFYAFCVLQGVNLVKRKVAEHDNLKITIEQNGDKFHVKESSTLRTKEVDFTLGVLFDYTLADGTEVSVSALKRNITEAQALGQGAVP